MKEEKNMREKNVKINCPTFQKQKSVIKNITDKINMAQRVFEKARFAEELQKEVSVLLSCPGYKAPDLDCKDCLFIGNLLKKTTNLIIEAENSGFFRVLCGSI